MRPTMRERPFRYVIDLCFSRFPPSTRSRGISRAEPRDVYPAAVVDRGKRFEAKSKAEETEKERLWVWGRRGFALARLEAESGSSAERDILREEEMPEGDDDLEA